MRFTVLSQGTSIPGKPVSQAYLIEDDWNDWFRFTTLYLLIFYDRDGQRHHIGGVKIGQFSMTESQSRAEIPKNFQRLDSKFFSLGQDDSYYEELNNLGATIREKILQALHDIALDQTLFECALTEKVTGVSLLRSVPVSTVKKQYHRIARGGARLTNYKFSYTAPTRSGRSQAPPVTLDFEVEPESLPPSNIHVLIGRNGVGKTSILNDMTQALIEGNSDSNDVGTFIHDDDASLEDNHFANLVSVTFSAFDPFEPIPNRQDTSGQTQYAYVGLKRIGAAANGTRLAPKTPQSLSADFGRSVLICLQGARITRWRRALEMLETDVMFQNFGVTELADESLTEKEVKSQARDLFNQLSSGHKIVLLTITRLVETVAERTLVVLDEPEAHLHPPLLSAFIRALSELLVDRNGVAIIATHSPVVLQEVPRRCAWKIKRSGHLVQAERPDIETFGENVGILTREVFGLEVTQAGFHKLLRAAVDQGGGFQETVDLFDNELGGEAKAIIRALVSLRDREADL